MTMEDWKYESVPDLDKSMIERLMTFPREPDMLIYVLRLLAMLFIRAWLKIYHRLEVVGKENLPDSGSFILIANHTSHLDTLSILSILKLKNIHRTFPAAASDYFFKSVSRSVFAATVVNALPFERDIHIRQSIQLCQHLLENSGNILILYPEGTRSERGGMNCFKPGIGLLIARTKVPVVPCYIKGCYESLSRNMIFPRPRKICLTIGKPKHFDVQSTYKEAAQTICQDLQQSVMDLKKE